MKKIELGGVIYNKIFSLSEKIFKKIADGDIDYIVLGEQLKQIGKYGNDINIPEGLFESIMRHYVVFDYNNGFINKVKDDSEEVNILRNFKFGFFEIISVGIDKVIYLDNSTGEKYEIIGEGMGSEKRLNSLNIGDLVIARIIKMPDGWYNLRNYFYFLDGDDNGRLINKYFLNGVKDVFEALEKVSYINKAANEPVEENINYERRIKKLFGRYLTKNLDRELNKILKNISEKTFFEFERFLENPNFKSLDKNIKSDIKSLLSAFINSKLNENIITKDENNEYSKRSYLVSSALMRDVEKHFELSNRIKYSSKQEKEIDDFKNNWYKTPNPAFSMKTPEEFLIEVKPDFKTSDIRIAQISEGELEFYDGYTRYFNDEEKTIYEQGLKKAKKMDSTSYFDFEKLIEEHGDFFRLRSNYIMTKYHYLIDKYLRKKFREPETIDEIIQDRNFAYNIKKEIKYVKKLKKGYIFPMDFEEYVEKINNNLIMLIGAYGFKIPKKEAKKLIKTKDNEKIISYLSSKIKDFNVDELIEKIVFESNFYVTSEYENENRFYEQLTGWAETCYFELFEYLWNKYKKDGYFIFNDAKIIYNNILIIDKNDKHNWNLQKIDEFGDMIDKLLILSIKENILDNFNSSIEVGDIIEPEYIYKNLADFGYKDKFKKTIVKLGYEL